ncbi:MAG: hypothetical protein KC592_17375, partial [Nitrospira sp.]|nr:hypothetical protein [Nitrospira sp.]
MSTALDGWRLSTARRFGLAKKTGEQVYIPLLIITIIPFLVPGSVVLWQDAWVLSILGVEGLAPLVVTWLMLYVVLEQINTLAEQYFHASGMTWVVNIVLLIEVVARTTVLFIVLPSEASLEHYLLVFVVFMA